MLENNPLLTFKTFASQSTYIDDNYGVSEASPGAENYENGFEPLQTLPATWYNSLLKRLTQQAQYTKTLCESIYQELCSVISEGNVQLDSASVVNLKTALHNIFDLHIATATVLGGVYSSAAMNKVLVNADGTLTPNALADWTSSNTVKETIDALESGTAGTIGNLSNLTTDAKSTIVAAINEVDSHTDANTTAIGNLQVDSSTPQTVQVQTAAAGSSSHAARADHTHAVSTGAATMIGLVSGGDVGWGANSEGTSTALARADHTHKLALQTASNARYGVTQTTSLSTILANSLSSDRTPDATTIQDLISCIGRHSRQISPQNTSYMSYVAITLTTDFQRASYQIFVVASLEYVGTAGYLLVWKGPLETSYAGRLIGLGTTSGCDIYYTFSENNVLVIGSSDGTPISVTVVSLFGYNTTIGSTQGSTSASLTSGTKICENYHLRLNLSPLDVWDSLYAITDVSVTSNYASGWVITFPDQGMRMGVWDLTVVPRIPGTPCVLRVLVAGSSISLVGVVPSYIMAPSGVNCYATTSGSVLTIAFNNIGSSFYQFGVQMKKVMGNGSPGAHTYNQALTSGTHVIFVGEEADIYAKTITLQ